MQDEEIEDEQARDASRPLVLHIRGLRQLSLERPLSRWELGQVAGLTERQVQHYETLRDLPASLDALLRIALALKVPVEALIDPRIVEQTSAQVERRRPLLDVRVPGVEVPRH